MSPLLRRIVWGLSGCSALLASLTAAAAEPVQIYQGVPLVVSPGTPEPVLLAVADLRRDLEKVLGAPSPIVDRIEPIRNGSAIMIVGPGWGEETFHHSEIKGSEANGFHLAP